jgi:hypothetical protein
MALTLSIRRRFPAGIDQSVTTGAHLGWLPAASFIRLISHTSEADVGSNCPTEPQGQAVQKVEAEAQFAAAQRLGRFPCFRATGLQTAIYAPEEKTIRPARIASSSN